MLPICLMIIGLMTARVEASDLPSAGGSKTPPKSKFNTQIYEQESDNKTFTDTVKTVREAAGQTQVFFNSQSGVFYLDTGLDSGRAQNSLATSQKKKTPVSVTVDMSSRQILKVSTSDSAAPSSD